MGSFAGSCEIVEEKKDEVRLSKHSGRSIVSNDVERRKQREYHGSLEYDIDKLFQSISLKPSTRLMTSSFHRLETSASAGPSRTTSPSMRMATRTPQSPRVFGVSDSLSLKQALRDRCVSKASEMAAPKRLPKSASASPRVSEADRIKSLYNQVSNNRSGIVLVDKGKRSLVETSLNDKASTPSKSDNATELEKKVLPSTLDNAIISGTEKSKTVRKVTRRMIPRPKQKPKKKKILLKIGIVSVANATKKDGETNVSLDSSIRCQCSLKSTSIDNHEVCADSLSSISSNIGKKAHQVASENSSGSCSQHSEAEIVVMKQDITENPTFSEKFEFSLSSKDSIGDYSRSTSMSEESNLSRFSCGNKPHMSMDLRWEAVKHAKLQYGALGLRHFNLLKKLGCGDIGTVYLAELTGTNCLFAIKVMDNEFLARRKKSPRAQAERDILKMLDHPFLPTLYAQFTSDNLSCLVIEYCPGGDLHVLRQKQLGRCFPEPAARFYVAEILLALEYLHMLGVIYRDLKPENILVREDGHIMLTDFDLSLRCSVNPTLLRSTSPPWNDPARTSGPYKTSNCIQPFCIMEPSCHVSCFSPRLSSSQQQGQKPKRADHLSKTQQHLKRSLPQLVAEPTEARSNSFVGTHEYLAPEIIRGEGHGGLLGFSFTSFYMGKHLSKVTTTTRLWLMLCCRTSSFLIAHL